MSSPRTASLPPGGVHADQLQNLLQISIELSAAQDRQKMLGMILKESRRLARAQAGTLYVRRENELEFAVAQNDAVDASKITQVLLGQTLRIGGESLAGFVAATAQAVSVPSTYRLDPGAPYKIHREFDAATGYRALTILAIPLRCPDGEVVGVLQLFNCVGPGGAIEAFPDEPDPAVLSLASLAAVEVHNALLTDRLKQAHLDTIIRLSMAAEFRDQLTAEHIQRISRLSALIARAFGWPEDQVELIQYASPMHDVGKIAIPDSILLKAGPLSPEERQIVETHPVIGAEILDNPTNDLMSMAHEIALFHHERWDGAGYPYHLRGRVIPLSARIVCLADVFDALITRRCYKQAYPVDEVLENIRTERGRAFDPELTQSFFDCLDRVLTVYNLQGHLADSG